MATLSVHSLSAPRRSRSRLCVRCSASEEDGMSRFPIKSAAFRTVACGLVAGLALTAALPLDGFAAGRQIRLPPISDEPNRCERAFIGNTIGQANGVYDKILDLRLCDFTGNKDGLKGKTLSSAIMSEAKFDGADMKEVVMSKAYAVGASFKGTDFTNAVLDRVDFDNADLKGAIFRNTVLSGSTFDGANLESAEFEDVLIGYNEIKGLCVNKTLSAEAKTNLGCR